MWCNESSHQLNSWNFLESRNESRLPCWKFQRCSRSWANTTTGNSQVIHSYGSVSELNSVELRLTNEQNWYFFPHFSTTLSTLRDSFCFGLFYNTDFKWNMAPPECQILSRLYYTHDQLSTYIVHLVLLVSSTAENNHHTDFWQQRTIEPSFAFDLMCLTGPLSLSCFNAVQNRSGLTGIRQQLRVEFL